MANTKDLPKDAMALGPVVNDRGDRSFLWNRGEVCQEGVVSFPKDGDPLTPGTTYAHILKREDGYYDVKEPFEVPGASSHGPAIVNSKAYLSGWDTIFGQKTIGQA